MSIPILLVHTPPPKSPQFSENVDFLLEKLLKIELEEALFVRGAKTDVINKDLEEVMAFLLISLFLLLLRGGLNQQERLGF